MANDWEVRRVEEIAAEMGDAPFGSLLKNDDYTDHGALVVQGKNIQGRTADWSDRRYVSHDKYQSLQRSHCQIGDLVFPKVGTIGKVGLVTPCLGVNEFILSTNTMRLRTDESIANRDFVYYFFTWSKTVNLIHALNSKSVQPVFNFTSLKNFQITLPPLPEQKAIAHILGTLDDKIKLNRRMNATLEAMARALFQSWFVDFDPVRAKLDGRPPAGLDEATALFPSHFQDSPLGPIPQGWRVETVGDVAARIAMGPFGSRITRDNFVSYGVPVVRGGNLTDGFVDNDFVFLTEDKADELKSAVARSQDIVFTHRGTLGQVGIIPVNAQFPRYVVSQSQMLLSIDKQKCSAWMVYLFFRSPQGEGALLANTSTTGVPAISRPTTSLKAIRFVVPPAEISKEFDKLVQPIFLKCEQLAQEIKTLATLRDTLLPKLLSGELSVSSNEVARRLKDA